MVGAVVRCGGGEGLGYGSWVTGGLEGWGLHFERFFFNRRSQFRVVGRYTSVLEARVGRISVEISMPVSVRFALMCRGIARPFCRPQESESACSFILRRAPL